MFLSDPKRHRKLAESKACFLLRCSFLWDPRYLCSIYRFIRSGEASHYVRFSVSLCDKFLRRATVRCVAYSLKCYFVPLSVENSGIGLSVNGLPFCELVDFKSKPEARIRHRALDGSVLRRNLKPFFTARPPSNPNARCGAAGTRSSCR